MTSTVSPPADARPDDPSSIRIRVSQYAAPLLEFILIETGLRWTNLVREQVEATVVIETTHARREDVIVALRQRLDGHLAVVD
jgi:hypothetical protein